LASDVFRQMGIKCSPGVPKLEGPPNENISCKLYKSLLFTEKRYSTKRNCYSDKSQINMMPKNNIVIK